MAGNLWRASKSSFQGLFDTKGLLNLAGMLLCLCGARLALENLLTYGLRWEMASWSTLDLFHARRVSASSWIAFLLGDPRCVLLIVNYYVLWFYDLGNKVHRHSINFAVNLITTLSYTYLPPSTYPCWLLLDLSWRWACFLNKCTFSLLFCI